MQGLAYNSALQIMQGLTCLHCTARALLVSAAAATRRIQVFECHEERMQPVEQRVRIGHRLRLVSLGDREQVLRVPR